MHMLYGLKLYNYNAAKVFCMIVSAEGGKPSTNPRTLT